MSEDTKLIPLADVAKMLNVAPGTIRQWIHRKLITPTKLGRDVFFTPEQIANRRPTRKTP